VLAQHGIATAGAGRSAEAAARPAAIALAGGRRILLFAFGSPTSGVPVEWAASADAPGIEMLPDLPPATAEDIARRIKTQRRAGDIVVISIHWGSNWGYTVPSAQQAFARALIDAGACDILHGHSSHHPRPVEVYRQRLILYGCGDLLNDYEGIAGQESYRGDLVLAYLPRLSRDGALSALELLAYRIRGLRLHRAADDDVERLRAVLARESAPFGTAFSRRQGHRLAAEWR
jgi:poly-gamma-glutamate synthesis protein (capsule biosynthesis protein)